MDLIFTIPARERIGRAKDISDYQDAYRMIEAALIAEIEDLTEGVGERL
ncbi:MAG: hypothetical protein HGB17_11510 [Syntrophobacteraceae bacterium]|nr:hypothetical protein [Syntrophobacteraceae bacterium]